MPQQNGGLKLEMDARQEELDALQEELCIPEHCAESG